MSIASTLISCGQNTAVAKGALKKLMFGVALGVLAAETCLPAVQAQETAASTAENSGADDDRMKKLGVVTVTARRKEETLQERM